MFCQAANCCKSGVLPAVTGLAAGLQAATLTFNGNHWKGFKMPLNEHRNPVVVDEAAYIREYQLLMRLREFLGQPSGRQSLRELCGILCALNDNRIRNRDGHVKSEFISEAIARPSLGQACKRLDDEFAANDQELQHLCAITRAPRENGLLSPGIRREAAAWMRSLLKLRGKENSLDGNGQLRSQRQLMDVMTTPANPFHRSKRWARSPVRFRDLVKLRPRDGELAADLSNQPFVFGACHGQGFAAGVRTA